VIHELKTWPEYFQDVLDGIKTFEIRKNDRNYIEQDKLLLKEWSPFRESFTGRRVLVTVVYILDNSDFVKEGFVVMGISLTGIKVNP
jgi:hypothetical protein